MLYRASQTQPPASPPSNSNSRPSLTPVAGAEPAHAIGPENAPVVLEEFGDFQCPPCAQLHPELKKMEKEYEGKLRFVFREFPLSQMHKYAYDAARAAEAAGIQGKFWDMHDLLYEKQLEWSLAPDPRAQIIEYAASLGLDAKQFELDLTGELTSLRVSLDIQRGQSLNVKATPSLLVNGRLLSGPETMDPASIRHAIDVAIQEKGR